MCRVAGSVYVHWPYCARRCHYCNFNKYIPSKDKYGDLEARMGSCIVREASTLLRLSGINHVRSVFFGGGTPSLMKPSTVNKVLQEIQSFHVPKAEDRPAEVTLEANPSDVTVASVVEDLSRAGVNRISLGMQALSDDSLKMLNRDHTAAEGFKALELSLKCFPHSTSVDLIFGRPGQTLNNWNQELTTLMQFPVHHVSLYQLTLERGTRLFSDVKNGLTCVPDEEAVAEMYEVAVERLESHGLSRYEVSNFAVAGHESRHNQWYWQGGEYVGVGPGAHGRFYPRGKRTVSYGMDRAIDEMRLQNEPNPSAASRSVSKQARIQTLEPEQWMAEVEHVGHGTRKIVELSQAEVAAELLVTSLRTREGVAAERLRLLTDVAVAEFAECLKFQQLADEGLLVVDKQGMRLTPDGLKVADFITPYLLNILDDLLRTDKAQTDKETIA